MAKDADWVPANMGEFRKILEFKDFSDNFCQTAEENQIPWILDTDNVDNVAFAK